MSEDRTPVGRLMGAIVPRAVDAIDPDALVDRIDVPHLIDRIDVDGLIQRVDLDALLQRIDLDRLLLRIDMDALLDRIDVDGIIRRVDLDALLARLDLNALVARLDVDALVARLDIDALVARLDVNALVARLDVNALVGRLDVEQVLAQVDLQALVARAGIDQIVAEATTGMAARTIDLLRRQIVGLDLILLRGVDRVFHRGREPLPEGPISPTGRPAGPVARTCGFLVDVVAVSLMFTVAVWFAKFLIQLFTGDTVQPTAHAGPFYAIAYFGWWGLYLWASLEIAGRTPGKALVGTRVVAVDQAPLGPGKALARTIAFPFSFILGLGFLPGVTRRDRRAFHDLVAGSQEVTDWGDRRAELPSALERWVEDHRVADVDVGPGTPAAGGTGTPLPS